MRQISRFIALSIAFLLLITTGAGVLAQSPVASPMASPVASPVAITHGVQTADMDLTVDPAEDFYQYANGGWLARTEIPDDSASFGVFDDLYLKTEAQQLAQLEALMNDNILVEGSDQWKAVEFFKQGTDMEIGGGETIAGALEVCPTR